MGATSTSRKSGATTKALVSLKGVGSLALELSPVAFHDAPHLLSTAASGVAILLAETATHLNATGADRPSTYKRNVIFHHGLRITLCPTMNFRRLQMAQSSAWTERLSNTPMQLRVVEWAFNPYGTLALLSLKRSSLRSLTHYSEMTHG